MIGPDCAATKAEWVEFAIAAGALALGAAAEEMLPKFSGVGFPLLMMACVYFATRRGIWPMFMFAAAAGAAEDSLCGLPFATSIAFFAMAAAFVRTMDSEWVAFALFPLYQLWVRMWCEGLHGGVFSRFLVSIPVGVVTAFAVRQILGWLDRKGAVDEE